jgi:hypothetical protein
MASFVTHEARVRNYTGGEDLGLEIFSQDSQIGIRVSEGDDHRALLLDIEEARQVIAGLKEQSTACEARTSRTTLQYSSQTNDGGTNPALQDAGDGTHQIARRRACRIRRGLDSCSVRVSVGPDVLFAGGPRKGSPGSSGRRRARIQFAIGCQARSGSDLATRHQLAWQIVQEATGQAPLIH